MNEWATTSYEIVAALLAVLLLVAAGAKASDLRSFMSALEGLGIPGSATRWVAAVTICGELTIASAVLLPVDISFAATAMAFLYVIFAFITIYAVWKRPGLSCSCFGRLANTHFSPGARLRGISLAALACCVAVVGDVVNPDVSTASPVFVALAGAALALLVMASAQSSRAIGRVAASRQEVARG